MKELTGRIADIQRFSLHDGPGIRTTVFFKGCPLHCAWCHNPECISFEKETLFYPEKCIGCGKCAEGCYSGARRVCGTDMTPEELLSEILRDRAYYGDGGGVTFSGGEPLAQPEFLSAILELCKREGLSCMIETSLVLWEPEILSRMDRIFADLKIWDEDTHRKYTGVGAEKIRENLTLADTLGVPITVRTPVIPEIEQGVPAIAEFAASLKNVRQYELLPYHPLGVDKGKALGKPQRFFSVPDKNFMKPVNHYAFLR